MHDANVAAARARAALTKKQTEKGPSDEEDELERNDGEISENSSSSSESQHAEKEDARERTLQKSKTLSNERSAEDNLQAQIDRQKKVNDKKMKELAETRCCYPTQDPVQPNTQLSSPN